MQILTLPRLMPILALLLTLTACSMKPIPRADLAEDKVDGVRKSLTAFRNQDRLQDYFEQAEVVAVYSFSGRGAIGVGLAYGQGLVFDNRESVIGHTRMWQISMGPALGGQLYRQVLFFKTREIYEAFTRSPADFAGQVNATAAIVGVSSTPSFNTEVAVFTQLYGGLLLEASVSAHRYTFAPITD